jgi:glutaredoxin 3
VFCSKVKEFLSQENVEYEERDIAEDETAIEELEELGVLTTPVILVDGEMVIGFDRPRLTRLLGI